MAFKIVLSEMSTVVIVSLNSLSGKSGIGSAPSDSKTLAKIGSIVLPFGYYHL